MLEKIGWQELYQQIPKQITYNNQQVSVEVYRARQELGRLNLPAVLIDFLPASIDPNTPVNGIFNAAASGQDVEYTKGVLLRQSIDLNILDSDIRRIAELEDQYFLWAKQSLSLTQARVIKVFPPRVLDSIENGLYRRNIEIVCRFAVTWQELVTTIEDVETSVSVQ